MEKQTKEKTWLVVMRAVIKVGRKEKSTFGWSGKASKAGILETHIIMSRPSDDLGEEPSGQR